MIPNPKFKDSHLCSLTIRYLLVFIAFFSTTQAWAIVAVRHYDVDASLDEKTHVITGAVHAHIENQGDKPVNFVWLLLYPNTLAEKPAFIDDVNLEWLYPKRFNPASMQISIPLEQGKLENTDLNSFVRLNLDSPLPPKEKRTLKIAFKTRVPERFGGFGHYRGMTVLNGGWFPRIAKTQDDNSLTANQSRPDDSVTLKWSSQHNAIFLNGKMLIKPSLEKETSGIASVVTFKRNPRIQQLNVRKLEPDQEDIDVKLVLTSRRSKKSRQYLTRVIAEAVSYAHNFSVYSQILSRRLTIIEIPMRAHLAQYGGQGVVYVSDRIFKVFPALRRYHAPALLQAMVSALIDNSTFEGLDSKSQIWFREAAGYHIVEEMLREGFLGHRDARNISLIRWFRFLPQVDEVLYTPQFPFVGAYFNLNQASNPFQTDFVDRFRTIPSGKYIYEKMKDVFGLEETKSFFTEMLTAPKKKTFQQGVIHAFSTWQQFESDWIGKLTSVNYGIDDVKKSKTASGYQYEITTSKSPASAPAEPVEVAIKTRSGLLQKTVPWQKDQKEAKLVFESPSKMRFALVDPRGRLLETSRIDNRTPPRYKFILTAFLFGSSFNTFDPNLFISTQFRKALGGKNRYNFSFSLNESRIGFSIGYGRLFGRLIDKLRLTHGLSVAYSVARLDKDFLTVNGSPLSPSGTSTRFSASYGFGNRVSFFNPREGVSASVGATLGSEYLGGDFNFFRASTGFVYVIPVDPQHPIVTRTTMGVVAGKDVPPQEQFILGGIDSVRGFSSNTLGLIGRNHLQINIEYRPTLISDMDVNAFGVWRFRKVQGALFSNAATVTDTVLEEVVTGRKQNDGDFVDIFEPQNAYVDSGVGLRFFFDTFGVRNTLLRLDFANRLRPSADWDPFFYFAFFQPF